MAEASKWNLPGWKVDRKFDKSVLVGNWYEDRLKFERTPQNHNSTYRRDFMFHTSQRPDNDVRRNAFLANQGLPTHLVFGHHGHTYDNNTITLYDEYFNKRERPGKQAFPETRYWDSKTMTWAPEKIDYPLQGEPTNWGLKGEIERKREEREKELKVDHFTSTYQLGFVEKPIDRTTSRYAVPRDKSSALLPVNRTNRNLNLRNVSTVLPQMPQALQIPRPYVL